MVAAASATVARLVAPALLSHAAPRPRERVLECAYGTGAVTLLVAERLAPESWLVSTDVSPAMIARAQEKNYAPTGAQPCFLLQSYTQLAVADSSFDVVLCSLGLHVSPDPLVPLREMLCDPEVESCSRCRVRTR